MSYWTEKHPAFNLPRITVISCEFFLEDMLKSGLDPNTPMEEIYLRGLPKDMLQLFKQLELQGTLADALDLFKTIKEFREAVQDAHDEG